MVRRAQELRYREFFPQDKPPQDKGLQDKELQDKLPQDKELQDEPPQDKDNGALRVDHDHFDLYCRHLAVYDEATEMVVATCRLLDQSGARQTGGFYTEKEFTLPFLQKNGQEVLEIGRFCVDQNHRQGLAPRLLWQALAECIEQSDTQYLFGCVSLSGVDPKPWKNLLQRLWQQHLAPVEIRPVALPDNRIDMEAIEASDDVGDDNGGAVDGDAVDGPVDGAIGDAVDDVVGGRKFNFPPLIKAYVRAGAYVGEGAVLDPEFSVIDICMIARTGKMISRYVRKERLL